MLIVQSSTRVLRRLAAVGALMVGLGAVALGSPAHPLSRGRRRPLAGYEGASTFVVSRPRASVRPDVAGLGGPGSRDAADLRRGVVYLDTAPRGAFDEREPARAVLDQHNERFVPHVLAVMVGTVVDFPQQRRDLPQRVLAVARQALRSRPLRRRAIESRCAWIVLASFACSARFTRT